MPHLPIDILTFLYASSAFLGILTTVLEIFIGWDATQSTGPGLRSPYWQFELGRDGREFLSYASMAMGRPL